MSLRKSTGTFFPFFIFILLNLSIFSFSRILISLWQFHRVNAAHGWLPVVMQGIRIDISTLVWEVGVIALLSSFIASENIIGRIWNFLIRIWLTLFFTINIFMEAATPSFINEYGIRPNRLFVEYLIYPKEVFSMLMKSHVAESAAILLITLISVVAGWKVFGAAIRKTVYPKPLKRVWLFILILVFGFMGGRSSFKNRPINPAMVAFSEDPLVNSIILNSFYSVGFAIDQLKNEAKSSFMYGKLDQDEVIYNVRKEMKIDESEFIKKKNYPTLHTQKASFSKKKKNIVIILEESLGAEYVGSLGGFPLTPNLDRLSKKGWFFKNLYAIGTRSVMGIQAVLCSFPPTPARSVVKLSKSQYNFFTIASLLKSKGYETEFIYGGESHFDNMKSFFLGNGFSKITDEDSYENPVFRGSWGVSDEDLFMKAHEEFLNFSRKNKNFFSLVFSSSNHDPFEFPENRIDLYEKPAATRKNAAKYADYAIGKFFEMAEKSPYWKDTIFLVIADHDSRTKGKTLVPVNKFHIPALILGKDIPLMEDQRVASQMDMPPTLLSLAGIDNINPMIGIDLTKKPVDFQGRAIMQYAENFGYMENGKIVILQPGKKSSFFEVVDKKISKSIDPDPYLKKKALSISLFGSIAYKKGLFGNSYLKSQ